MYGEEVEMDEDIDIGRMPRSLGTIPFDTPRIVFVREAPRLELEGAASDNHPEDNSNETNYVTRRDVVPLSQVFEDVPIIYTMCDQQISEYIELVSRVPFTSFGDMNVTECCVIIEYETLKEKFMGTVVRIPDMWEGWVGAELQRKI